MLVMVSHGFHSALEFIVNFPGHFEENLDTGTKLLFPGQSRETRDGWQVCSLIFPIQRLSAPVDDYRRYFLPVTNAYPFMWIFQVPTAETGAGNSLIY